MNEHDKNFLINMSPFLIVALVMFFMMVAFETKAEKSEILYSTTEEPIGIVGYTEHGIAVTKEDLQVRNISVRSIRGYSIQNNNVIRVRTARKQEYDIELYFCSGLQFAGKIVFVPWGGFTTIGRGDKVIPISFGRPSRQTCIIKSITLVADVG
jgi:hypothetical protein